MIDSPSQDSVWIKKSRNAWTPEDKAAVGGALGGAFGGGIAGGAIGGVVAGHHAKKGKGVKVGMLAAGRGLGEGVGIGVAGHAAGALMKRPGLARAGSVWGRTIGASHGSYASVKNSRRKGYLK